MKFEFSYLVALTLAALILSLLLGFPVKWLWNAAVVPATGANPITFWQAVGLIALARTFFGNTTTSGKSE